MFEKEIFLIKKRIENSCEFDNDLIEINSILESAIPIGIKKYILSELNIELSKEKKSENKSKFIYKNESIISLEKQRDNLLIKNHKLTKKEFDFIIENGVNFCLNLLCRPQWTIQNLFFQSNNIIDIVELKPLIKFIFYYEYFPLFIEKFLSEKKDFTRIESEKLLRNIDENIQVNQSLNEIMQMIKPIFDFVSFSSIKNDDIFVPIKSLIYFFKEKGRKNIVLRLEIELKNNISEINFKALENLIGQCDLNQPLNYKFEILESAKIKFETPLSPLFTLEEEKHLCIILFSDDLENMKNFISIILNSENLEFADEQIREYFAENKINFNSVDATFFHRTILNRYKILTNKNAN